VGKLAPERLNQCGARDDGMAVASVGPYAKHLHLIPDRYHDRTSTFNLYRPDALPYANQKCQSTEGKEIYQLIYMKMPLFNIPSI